MSNNTDPECGKTFLQQFIDGHGSIEQIYHYPKFRKKLRGFCYRYNFQHFKQAYGPEDLYQDACVKVWYRRAELLKPGNVMTEQEFFNWLFVVTRNHYYSRVRQINRARKNGLLFDDTPIEDLDIIAPDEDYEGGEIFKRFLEFIEQYSEARQYVIRLWLECNSYRDIAEELQRTTPFRCSHVTASNWTTAALNAFRESLSATPAQPAAQRTGTRIKSIRVRNLKRSIAG